MIWYKYGEQDYMDIYPHYGYRLFEDDAQAKAWEKYMKEYYASGDTWLCGPATQAEILEYIKGMDLDQLTLNNINNADYYAQQNVKTTFITTVKSIVFKIRDFFLYY